MYSTNNIPYFNFGKGCGSFCKQNKNNTKTNKQNPKLEKNNRMLNNKNPVSIYTINYTYLPPNFNLLSTLVRHRAN